MTVLQKQCLLTYLGYNTGGVDGIWGAKSKAAMQQFAMRYGTSSDEALLAAVKEPTVSGDFWGRYPNFTKEEFRCKCGGKYCGGYPAEVEEGIVALAQQARSHFGSPATVVSGLRCKIHNANVGGVENSRHMSGKAVDLCVAGVTSGALLSFLQQQKGIRYAYAINGSNVHFDIA